MVRVRMESAEDSAQFWTHLQSSTSPAGSTCSSSSGFSPSAQNTPNLPCAKPQSRHPPHLAAHPYLEPQLSDILSQP